MRDMDFLFPPYSPDLSPTDYHFLKNVHISLLQHVKIPWSETLYIFFHTGINNLVN